MNQASVVGGWRPETGSRDRIGALLVGVPDERGGLAFAGRVGSGISHRQALDLSRELGRLPADRSPFSTPVPDVDAAGATWCQPGVVVEVRHTGWTAAGRLRQPVFRGIRSDLSPSEVRRES
jgi:bifunctional non-homologous end joining protein LigD